MAIVSSDKIFVDPKEEINFIIDRALKSEKERIIFVIPQNSILLSSPVSINILYKELSKTNKIAVIVTEDSFGATLSAKAGFIVASKVSQIVADDWEKALTKKLRYIDRQEKLKKELLSNIGLVETAEVNESDEPVDTSSIEDKKVVEPEEPKEVEKEEEVSATNFLKKPRNPSKVVSIGGIKIAAAGDIRAFLKEDEDAKIPTADNFDEDKMNKSIPDRKIRSVAGASSFAGKDFTKKIASPKGGGFFGNLFGKSKNLPGEGMEEALKQRARRKKILIGLGIFLLISLFGGGYLFAFQFSSVDLSIRFKKEDLSGTADVVLGPDITEVSFNPVTIPARTLREDSLSASRSGEATGTSKKGVKAKGFVTIYNLTSNPINLAVGTVLTNPATQRKYLIQEAVSLEAGSPSAAFFAGDIPIEAEDFGTEYNIPVSVDSTSLEIAGYASEFASKRVYARVFNEISGGSSTEFVSVTQENIDALKEVIVRELTSQGESRIRASLTSGYTLIPETIEFTENRLSSIPEIGEEAKDSTFTLSVEGVVTAYAVLNDDLKLIAQRVLSEDREDENDNGDLVFENVDVPRISEVSIGDPEIIITITTQASVGIRPTDENLRNAVAGKSVRDANEYIASLESVEDFSINFTPSFLPETFRFIPSDTSRISIRSR